MAEVKIVEFEQQERHKFCAERCAFVIASPMAISEN